MHSELAEWNGRHEILRHRNTPIVPRRRSILTHRATNGTRPAKRRSKTKIKILYVENNASVAKLVQDNLELEGCDVEVCREGIAAMEKIAAGTAYDLLLLDKDLPEVSGEQLARLARSMVRYHETPIVILSAASD